MEKKEEKKFIDYFDATKHKLPYWSELPEIDLYMDQVIVLMEKYLPSPTSKDSKIITSSMINNYVKLGIMPAPVKKKYSRVHIAYLIIICSLKQVIPIPDIKNLIEIRVSNSSIEETLNFFSDLYESIFKTVVAIGNKFNSRSKTDSIISEDTALYMAIGSNISKYVSGVILDMNKGKT